MYNNYLPMYEYLLDHNPQCSNDGGDEPKPNTKARNAVTMKQIVRRLSRRPTIGFFLIIIYAIVQIGRSNYRLFQVNPTDSSVSSSIGNNLISARKQYTDKKPLTALPPLVLTPGPIFYNIFIPSIEDNDLSRIKQILQEQFIQRNETSPNATIMYTLIGSDSATSFRDKIMVDGMCQPHCKLREHLPNGGDEVHTLQAVWNYCQSAPQNSSHDTLVSYIHDKGSFHPTPANDKARRMATKAALECRNLLLTSKNPRVCTICCGAFHVLPQYLASANMWTARCSYIRRLQPPSNYSNVLQSMYDTTLNHSVLRNTKYACLIPNTDAPNHLGLGRYALERWPFSHPDVKPCDVLPYGEGEVEPDFPQKWQPRLQRAPHKKPRSIGIQYGPYKASFARLAGRLHEWEYVYGKIPENKSWIWKWYRGYEEGPKKYLERCRAVVQNHSYAEKSSP